MVLTGIGNQKRVEVRNCYVTEGKNAEFDFVGVREGI